MADAVNDILNENERRRAEMYAPFNPVTGEGSVGERKEFVLPDFPIPRQWLPVGMMKEPLVQELAQAGSMRKYIEDLGEPYDQPTMDLVVEAFIRIRFKYDYPFWAATLVYIKPKGGGDDILFRLNKPQRQLVERFERMRLAKKPIRLIICKARQWGGSTCTQLYMAWLQLIHQVGLNSLIIAHQGVGSDEIKDMFDRMIAKYPAMYLHSMNDAYSENEPKMVGVGKTGNINRVPQRNCKIKIGTAERPQSCLGGDYNLVHLSEVSKWRETLGKKPEDIVDSACSGVLYRENTMIVEESTPDGVGNYYHKEYLAAKEGKSQLEAMFLAWFEIELYQLDFEDSRERLTFAEWLFNNRNNDEAKSDREQPGVYLWRLWEKGATLEAIHWYVVERAKFNNFASMASMYPSDDIEAFTFSGRKVFDNEEVEAFRAGCRQPKWRGEIYGSADEGAAAFDNLRFKKEENGRLAMWQDVERDPDNEVLDRYLVVVDVCKGHTEKADFADILVLDRMYMVECLPPVVVAEWHGHIDMDKLAWKAAQVAAYYNNALLVIESNTLETNNTKGEAEYILKLIADVYENIYTRKQSAEDIKQGLPRKYGFHTNPVTKKEVIYELKVAIRERLYIEREEEALNEYLTYVETDKGGFEAMEGYHDDRLMTRAIALYISTREMEVPRVLSAEANRQAGWSAPVVSAASV